MLRASFVLRRTRSAWLLVSCLMVSVLITSALVSALISFYSVALPAAVRHELAASGAMAVTLTAETSGSAGPVTAAVTDRMRTAFGPVPYQQVQSVWSNDLKLPGGPATGSVPVIQAASFTGLSAHARLVTGSWPAAPQAGHPVGVALPAAAAARIRLRVGSVLHLHFVGETTGATVRVTGIFRPLDASATYWRLNSIGPSGASSGGGFTSYGPAVVSPAAFAPGGALTSNQATFVLLPDLSKLKAGDLTALAARLRAADAALSSGGNTQVSTAMPRTLVDVAEGLLAARSLVLISGLQLLLLAGASLALAGRLLASHRDEETALLAARGAARLQLLRPSLAEGLAVCATAAAAGAVGGVWLAAELLSSVVGQRQQAVSLGVDVWLAAGLVLVGCLLIVLWPALRPPAIAAVRIRRGRQAAVASAAAAGADIALVALAVVCVHELLSYSAAAGGAGIDPVIVVAPALALAGLALIPLRLLPLAARGLERLTARSRRLSTAMASWELSRRPVRQSGPALLVILAVGTSTLALAQYESWHQSVHDQAAFSVGAPVRVGLATAVPLSGVTGITRLRGVTTAMPVSQEPLTGGQLLAIGAPQAAATVTMRSDLAGGVAQSRLWTDLDRRPGAAPGLAVPGRPERLALAGSLAGGYVNQLGPVSASLVIQDAYGLTYTVSAGTMRADGRIHQLVASLGDPHGIAYPLRILGVQLSFRLPARPLRVVSATKAASAAVTIQSVAASPAASGSFGAPFAPGSVLAGWKAVASAPTLSGVAAALHGSTYGAQAPVLVNTHISGQAGYFGLTPGSGPYQASPFLLAQDGIGALPGLLQIVVPPPAGSIPLLATTAFVRANGLHVGSALPISIAGTSVQGTIVAEVSHFPTVSSGGAVIADQAALQAAVISADGVPVAATSWWLATAGGRVPAGLPPGSSSLDAASVRRSLEQQALSAAPVRAALAVAAAAAVLAIVGLCVSIAASARSRRGQRALLAALGVPADAQARLFCLEEVMISAPAALVGLVIGVLLARVLVPAVTLTATAGLPLPPVLVRIPMAWVAAIAVGVAVIPVLAAAIAVLRQPDPAAELRAVEAAG